MGSSLGRYLVVRAVLGGTVAGLVALPMAGAHPPVAPLFLGWISLSSLIATVIYRRWVRCSAVLLGILLALDLGVEAFLVATTGISRSPFVLLFSLTIGAAGLFFGVVGGIVMAAGAAISYWGVILRLGEPPGIGPVLATLLLLVLGLLFGRLGRRMASHSIEMSRVRDELERVRLDAEAIVTSLTGPLLCLDRSGGIRRINRAAAALLGLDGHLVDVRLVDVGAPERIAPLLAFVDKAFQGADCSAEIDLPEADGRPATPVEVSASSVRDRSGRVQGLVLLLSDLTRRKEQEAEHARKERLAVVGELSGHLAHEIRNSLKPMVGSVELLEGEIAREGTAGELLEIILRESESLEIFLSDFLTFSQDKTLTQVRFDLDELIKEQIAALTRHPARKEAVTLTMVTCRSREILFTDRDAVRDIMRNLIINALEATTEGEVRVYREAFGSDVELVVEDTGTGLPEGDPEELFEAFRTHKRGGTGLGLSIARRLARRLSGDVVLESMDGGGARSRLLLRGCRLERLAA